MLKILKYWLIRIERDRQRLGEIPGAQLHNLLQVALKFQFLALKLHLGYKVR